MNIKDLKFNRNQNREFVVELNKRVNAFFKENDITRYANTQMVVKTIVLMLVYFGAYALIISGAVTNLWVLFICWMFMAFGMAGLGFSVMHDANHGAYSRNKNVNKVLGAIIFLIGGNTINWKIQHNILHHSFTNVDGMDEDIDAGNLLRFSPNQEHFKFHRFQHIYAWFLYGLMTHMWITTKDFKQVYRYHKNGMLKQYGRSYPSALTETILTKVLYYVFALVIPLIFSPVAWYVTVIFFMLMHFVVGLTLACVFQTAHVMESSEFPAPNEEGHFENNWAIHQLLTTTNFAPKSRILSWFIGGLNYQIEHHLFPNICHIHYPKLSKIVKETAQEYKLPYYSLPTFWQALVLHGRMLRTLGQA